MAASSEGSQKGLTWSTADPQGTGKWTGVGRRLAEDLKVATGPEFTGGLNMDNGRSATEEMMEGGSEGPACSSRRLLTKQPLMLCVH